MERDYQKVSFWVRKADLPENSLYHFLAATIYVRLVMRRRPSKFGNGSSSTRRDFYTTFLRNWRCRLMPRDLEHFLDGLKRAGLHCRNRTTVVSST